MAPDAQKLVAGSLLLGASALPIGSYLSNLAGDVGVNLVSDGVGAALPAGPPLGSLPELHQAYTKAFKRSVDQLQREYQAAYGAGESLTAFDLLRQSAANLAQAKYPSQAGDILDVQRVLVTSLDGLLYGHPERQVRFLKERLLERMAQLFQQQLANNQQAWNLFSGWLLQRMMQQNAALHDVVARMPTIQTQDEDLLQAQLDAATDQLAHQLDALREELQRIAAGQSAAAPSRSHTMHISGNAQVGTAVAGDVHGGITVNKRGNDFRNASIGSIDKIVQGDEVHGDKVAGDKVVGSDSHEQRRKRRDT